MIKTSLFDYKDPVNMCLVGCIEKGREVFQIDIFPNDRFTLSLYSPALLPILIYGIFKDALFTPIIIKTKGLQVGPTIFTAGPLAIYEIDDPLLPSTLTLSFGKRFGDYFLRLMKV